MDILKDLKEKAGWLNYYPQAPKEPATWSIDADTKDLIRKLTILRGKKNQSVMVNELLIRGIKHLQDEENNA